MCMGVHKYLSRPSASAAESGAMSVSSARRSPHLAACPTTQQPDRAKHLSQHRRRTIGRGRGTTMAVPLQIWLPNRPADLNCGWGSWARPRTWTCCRSRCWRSARCAPHSSGGSEAPPSCGPCCRLMRSYCGMLGARDHCCACYCCYCCYCCPPSQRGPADRPPAPGTLQRPPTLSSWQMVVTRLRL